MVTTIEGNEQKLKILREKLEKANRRYSRAEEELEDAQSELDSAEAECNGYEEAVMQIEDEIKLMKVNKRFITEPEFYGSFEWCFYHAAMFCRHYDNRNPGMRCVNVRENCITGCDGYTAIRIICNAIPEGLKSKLYMWDTIDFDSAIPQEHEYMNIDKVFAESIENSKASKTMTKEQIESLMLGEGVVLSKEVSADRTMNVFVLGNENMAANKDYIEKAIKCFKPGESIEVMWNNCISPIIFRNEMMDIMILPMRR